MAKKYQIEAQTIKEKGNYRLRLGPLSSEKEAKALLHKIQKTYHGAFIVHQKKR